MQNDWTIDTYVLYRAADVDYDAVELLNRILRQQDQVVLDHERKIEKEYHRCLMKVQRERRAGGEVLKKWLKTVVAKLATKKYSGHLQKRHQRALLNLKFDRDDWPFVAVCAKSGSRRLISEDSDYTEDIMEYLRAEMAVNVLSIEDALA